MLYSAFAFGRGVVHGQTVCPATNDTLTHGHFVFYLLESIMQVRSANSSVHTPAAKHDPIIIAFGLGWVELYRAPLSRIEGMAYGVREDYESGYRGIKHNWCTAKTSERVHAWSTPSI